MGELLGRRTHPVITPDWLRLATAPAAIHLPRPPEHPLTLQDRADLYNAAFPDYPKMWADKGWLLGVWSIGAYYKGSGYHGSYPPSYLKRITTLFPDRTRRLHLFSGSLEPGSYGGERIDINPETKPDIVGDAHQLSAHVARGRYDLILADPPYTAEDADRYGTTMVKRNTVVSECAKVLAPGGFLCWMDMVLPMYSKLEFKRVGEIYISRSTNHRVRAVFVFERQ